MKSHGAVVKRIQGVLPESQPLCIRLEFRLQFLTLISRKAIGHPNSHLSIFPYICPVSFERTRFSANTNITQLPEYGKHISHFCLRVSHYFQSPF